MDRSERLAYLTPSSYERIRACRLQQAFAQSSTGSSGTPRSAAAALGIAVHAVLQRMIESETLFSNGWRAELDAAWVKDTVDLATNEYPATPVERWPDFNLTHARLAAAAERLRAILDEGRLDTTLLCELLVTGREGRLRGRVDLVLRGERHEVVDFKAGRVLESHTDAVQARYVRQLMLYSAMEAETSGAWPNFSRVISLADGDCAIPVSEDGCTAEADRAMDAIEAFNEAAPGQQPATTSVESCGSCPYAARCQPFWSAAATMPEVASAAGRVLVNNRSLLGGATLTIEPTDGSLGSVPIVVQHVDPIVYKQLADAPAGAAVWIVGLWRDPSRGTFRLGRAASLTVSAA